jgi:hypothetical protein
LLPAPLPTKAAPSSEALQPNQQTASNLQTQLDILPVSHVNMYGMTFQCFGGWSQIVGNSTIEPKDPTASTEFIIV